jgi:hypothetical protein
MSYIVHKMSTEWTHLTIKMFYMSFKPEREEVVGERRKLRNDALYKLYFSRNNIMVVKSRGGGGEGVDMSGANNSHGA